MSTTPHPRLPAADRRAQLIDVAMDLFASKGFAGTTTKEIAAAAGVTEAIIFRHFATKKELYQAIVESRGKGDRIQQWLTETRKFMAEDNDEGLFRNLMAAVICSKRDNARFEKLMQRAALESVEFAEMTRRVAAPFFAEIAAYVGRRQADGAFRPGDPMSFVSAAFGMADYYASDKYLNRSAAIQMSDEDAIQLFLGIFLNGIRVKEEKAQNI